MNMYRAECVTELGPNRSEPSERGAPMRAHTKQLVTMNVYRTECVTELGSNNSEPERARAHLCTNGGGQPLSTLLPFEGVLPLSTLLPLVVALPLSLLLPLA